MNVIRQRYVLFWCTVFPVYGMDTLMFQPKDTTHKTQEVSAPINIPFKSDTNVLATCLTMNRYLGGSPQSPGTPVGSFENSPDPALIALADMMNQGRFQHSSFIDAHGTSGNSTR